MSAAADPRATCIIGVARHTWHPDDAEVRRRAWPPSRSTCGNASHGPLRPTPAAADRRDAVLRGLQSVDIVYSQSWQYDDAATRLAERVGASPGRRRYSGIGGSVPLVLSTEVAKEIRAGGLDLALLTGAEALATVRRLKKVGEKPQWSYKPAEKRRFPMDMEFDPSELSHQVFEAYLTFALFDNARRAHLGRALPEHREALGRVMAAMTSIAADGANRAHSCIVARSAEEIETPTPDNRMVAYPYTKLMTSIMDVDMAAAVVLASAEKADALGVPEEKRVYLRGLGLREDPVHVAGHPDLWRSPAMKAAADAALSGAGISADDVAHLDLYSCFASSVCFGLDALDITEDDPRAASVTVTGGLPYHGGPGSNYMTHSLAAMTETLRADAGSCGVVSGVGMHMQKHAYGVWSTSPGQGVVADPASYDAGSAPVRIEGSPEGEATVATYSVLHGRDGEPERALLVCDVAGGSSGAGGSGGSDESDGGSARCYAFLEGGAAALAEAEVDELIGRSVTIRPSDGVNHATLG